MRGDGEGPIEEEGEDLGRMWILRRITLADTGPTDLSTTAALALVCALCVHEEAVVLQIFTTAKRIRAHVSDFSWHADIQGHLQVKVSLAKRRLPPTALLSAWGKTNASVRVLEGILMDRSTANKIERPNGFAAWSMAGENGGGFARVTDRDRWDAFFRRRRRGGNGWERATTRRRRRMRSYVQNGERKHDAMRTSARGATRRIRWRDEKRKSR